MLHECNTMAYCSRETLRARTHTPQSFSSIHRGRGGGAFSIEIRDSRVAPLEKKKPGEKASNAQMVFPTPQLVDPAPHGGERRAEGEQEG